MQQFFTLGSGRSGTGFLAQLFKRNVLGCMAQHEPAAARAAGFARNYATLEKDLLALDGEIKAIVARAPDQLLVASHPVYQYFTRRYGLNLESVLWEPDEVPSEALWSEFELGLRDRPAQWMIWEGEPNPDSVMRLHGMGVESLVFDPAGNRPDEGDFLSVMRQNLKNLQRAFPAH